MNIAIEPTRHERAFETMIDDDIGIPRSHHLVHSGKGSCVLLTDQLPRPVLIISHAFLSAGFPRRLVLSDDARDNAENLSNALYRECERGGAPRGPSRAASLFSAGVW